MYHQVSSIHRNLSDEESENFSTFSTPLVFDSQCPIPGFWISSGIVQCFYKESSKYQLIRAEQIIIQIIKLLLRP